jgi:hypothetical protein
LRILDNLTSFDIKLRKEKLFNTGKAGIAVGKVGQEEFF